MRFWDTSAVVPLLLREPATSEVAVLFDSDSSMAVWWATPVELESALARSHRQRRIDEAGWRQAVRLARELTDACLEIQPVEAVRRQALRLARTHPLRAADALQLAAALTWCENRPDGVGLVTLDDRLLTAATKEGFDVLPR